MANRYTLSEGSLDIILEQRNEHLRPIVQILGTKVITTNQRVRAVIFDGRTACQHCIFASSEIEQKCHRGELEKFTVIRLEKYTIATVKDNPVVVVNDLTVIKSGAEVGEKLKPNEPIIVGNGSGPSNMDSYMDDLDSKTNGRSSMSATRNRAPMNEPDVEINQDSICPINVLTPFYNAWVIRALVINKGQLRTYSNKRGDGKVFSFDVCDDSGEIRITCFNDECDRFYDQIEKDRMYYIGKGTIKTANKKFSSVNNDYECSLNSNSFVKPCNDGSRTLEAPKLRFKFTPLSSIAQMEANTTVDVIGVIRSVGETETLISKKTSKELIKREVTIVDKSKHEARLTLWGEQAQNFQGESGQVLALKGASIGDFMGKTLSARDSTNILLNPEYLPECHLMKTWYQQLNMNQESFQQLSRADGGAGGGGKVAANTKFVAQILQESIQVGETKNFTCLATIQSFNRISTHLYKSCGLNGCQKKVQEDQNGIYHCPKCDRDSPTFAWRLKVNLLLSDASSSFWVTTFQENMEKMLNKTVVDLANMYESDQNAYYDFLSQSLRFKKYTFKIYSRLDSYNNEARVRHTISQVYPSKSTKDQAQYLMKAIDAMLNSH